MLKHVLFFFCGISLASAQIQSEDFEGSTLPDGWSQEITGDGEWEFGDNFTPNTDFDSGIAKFDDDALGDEAEPSSASLLSPPVDLTSYATVSLEFDYYLDVYITYGMLTVEVFDGAAWHTLQTTDVDVTTLTHATFDVTPYKNAAFQVKFTYDDEGNWGWAAAIDNFLLTSSLGNRDFDNRPDFAFYPNPVDKQFAISSKGTISQVQITDVAGKTILTTKPDHENKVDASGLNSGIYFVTVTFENGTVRNQRMIKK